MNLAPLNPGWNSLTPTPLRPKCIVCKNVDIQVALVYCGHASYCLACIKKVVSNPNARNCMICKAPIIYVQILDDAYFTTKDPCKVCRMSNPDSVLIPCGHVICCKACVPDYTKASHNRCTTCSKVYTYAQEINIDDCYPAMARSMSGDDTTLKQECEMRPRSRSSFPASPIG